MIRFGLIFIFSLFMIKGAIAQLLVVPLGKAPGRSSFQKQARTLQDTTAMELPFWDDFSFSNSPYYPHDTLWEYGNSVLLNDGIGIRPPSQGIVTFDGIDSLGQPYNVANPLAKGYADKLISSKLRLDLVPADQLDSIYLSFYYQFDANGEAPDPGDLFQLDFLSNDGQWVNQFSVTYDPNVLPDSFYVVSIKVSDAQFLHENFQFRFRNFGRLSGPYDTWNLDYVYMNTHRYNGDTSFPDRTITRPLTAMFGEYTAMPIKHFRTDPSVITHPSMGLHNMEYIPGNTNNSDVQPIDYTSSDSIIVYKNSTGSTSLHALDTGEPLLLPLQPLEFRDVLLTTVPDLTSLDPDADSAYVYLKVKINSGDNKFPTDPVPGDYDPKYVPINFRANDKIKSQNVLSNYYAYDDGTAEYGAGLNRAGSQVSYKFDMKTPGPDTVVAVDIYFPRFGDESSQNIKLRILRDLSDTEESILYEEIIPVIRGEMNKFIRHDLYKNTVGVQGSFYMGWAQSTDAIIAVGWDKNTDTGDKIFFNTGSGWEPNVFEHGSLMFRPVFGKGDIPTGLPEKDVATAFPNPNQGIFYLSEKADQIQIFDMAGKPASFYSEAIDHLTRVELANATPGIYIMKSVFNNRLTVQKVMVRP